MALLSRQQAQHAEHSQPKPIGHEEHRENIKDAPVSTDMAGPRMLNANARRPAATERLAPVELKAVMALVCWSVTLL